MSDIANPAWVDRLRPASFVSPSGVVSEFKIDTLTRVGGKKASIHEILNKDEAIPQDQGNRSEVYSVEAYFTGENGDQDADTFYASLRERYSASAFGVLHHPRWGDINVMPFEFQQVEQLVTGAGIFRIPVEFREIPIASFPSPSGVDQSQIVADVSSLESTITDAAGSIDITESAEKASFIEKVTDIVHKTKSALSSIASGNADVANTFDLISRDILSSVGDVSPDVTISQLVNLMRSPAKLKDATLAKIQGYSVLVTDIINSFVTDFTENFNTQDKLNNARVAEGLILGAVSITAEAGLFTDYDTRDAAGGALDIINCAFDDAQEYLSELYGVLDNGVVDSFAPDHDTLLGSSLIIGNTNAILIDRSFSLKAKQITVLSGNSDPITLTYEFYGSLDELEFFIRTNNLADDEIIEIPAGREIIAYV